MCNLELDEARRIVEMLAHMAQDLIVELMDIMVERGLDRVHYEQLLRHVRARGTTCHEFYQEQEVRPADVLALQGESTLSSMRVSDRPCHARKADPRD